MSSGEAREAKVRRFSSFAALASPINPFSRRDRSGMPFPKSPSSKALVAPDAREEPPPPLKRAAASRMPSFMSFSNSMPPPPPRTERQVSERQAMGRLPRSQTTSNIPLLSSSAPSNAKSSPTKRQLSGNALRKATGLRQPSQSTNSLIRTRLPTPHRWEDQPLPDEHVAAEPLPTTAHSSTNLLQSGFPGAFHNVRSKLPTPAGPKDMKQAGASKIFAGLTKTARAKVARSSTQPNLPSVTNTSGQFATPRKTIFREEFTTKTPRYMASGENHRPPFLPAPKQMPAMDDLFGFHSGSEITDDHDYEELKRYGTVSKEIWGSPAQFPHNPEAIGTPTTVKPRRFSNLPHSRRASQLPRLHSASSIPQQGLLAPLSPPFPPSTPRHTTAHSQTLAPPGSGARPPNILRHSGLSPCPEHDHRAPFTTTWAPPRSPDSSTTTTSSPPSSPSPSPSAPHVVSTAQPTAYWAGRFASLFDRQRLAAFHAEGQAFRASGRVSDTFAAFVEADDERRARRVLAELAACCVTDDAARSLRAFQREFARRCGSDALMPSPALIVLGGSGGGADEGLRGGEGKGRKTGLGFMERLRGIAREARKSSV
ncbi:hypothetical protein SLS56_001805 [Neofusicoccum ribis]|uniref:Uncharacterized protein n=1 Tax=Neofusicoccum ribis TaxID=45134 RepID=A0ABR3T730_9PEZI